MGANINLDEIYRLIGPRGRPDDPDSQTPFVNYGQPRWTPSLTGDNLEDDESEYDANYAQYYSRSDDDELEYAAASTVTSETSTMSSVASSSVFSGRRRRPKTNITVPTARPHNPHPTFVQQFQNPGAGPPRPGQTLWCEFFGLLNCHATFRLDEEAEWIQHHAEHLGNRFPQTLMCWFCDHVPFAAEDPRDAFANFVERMEHVRQHILGDHRRTTANTRRDLHLVTHMHDQGILNGSQFEVAMQYDETPEVYRLTGDHSYPPSSSSYQQPLGQSVRVEFHDLKKEERELRRQKRQQRQKPSHRQ